MAEINEHGINKYTYDSIYKRQTEIYEGMFNEYIALINSPEYREATYSTLFDFLRILYLAKRIDIYTGADKEQRPVFQFSSVQEALSTYIDIANFKTNSFALLDKASLIVLVSDMEDKINQHVNNSDFLSSNLIVAKKDVKVQEIAKECLQILPVVSKEITPALRTAILIDITNTLSETQVKQLAVKNLFNARDIDSLVNTVITPNGKHNIEVLCAHFNMEVVPVKSEILRLKGTSFTNDDGTSRQEYLKELESFLKQSEAGIALNVVPYIYKPEIGASEPAVKVCWGDKELGFLPKDVALQLYNEYADKITTIKANKIVGGGTVTYGLEVTLDICEKAREITELEKEQ